MGPRTSFDFYIKQSLDFVAVFIHGRCGNYYSHWEHRIGGISHINTCKNNQ